MPRLLHASGRFDAESKDFALDLARWMVLASIITLTEVARPARWRKITRLVRSSRRTAARQGLDRAGWTRTSARGEGRGECAILTDRAVLRRLRKWVLPITKGGGTARLRRRLWLVAALLEHRLETWRLLVLATHMPAQIETVLRAWHRRGRTGPLTPQARAWLTALDSLAEHTADLRRAHPAAHVWIACDWNVDAGADWARDLILDAFRRHGMADLRVVAPAAGTLGARSIDFFVTDLADVDVVDVLRARSSDHDAVLAAARP